MPTNNGALLRWSAMAAARKRQAQVDAEQSLVGQRLPVGSRHIVGQLYELSNGDRVGLNEVGRVRAHFRRDGMFLDTNGDGTADRVVRTSNQVPQDLGFGFSLGPASEQVWKEDGVWRLTWCVDQPARLGAAMATRGVEGAPLAE